jgi:hypothetical protein
MKSKDFRKMKTYGRLFIALTLFAVSIYSSSSNAAPASLTYYQIGEKTAYQVALLNLAMQLTESTDGPYSVQPVDSEELTMGRGLKYLETGEIANVAFLAANQEREDKFRSVKMPIMQGIFGYRIFIIRKESQDAFSKIGTLEELKASHKAGFGKKWADMKILKLNEIPVVGSAKTDRIFKMLSGKRFDYFPRGISEPWIELKKRAETHPSLTVEQSKAFYYPYPVYFYVTKSHTALAERINRGLKLALKDGSFKELFLKHHTKIIEKAQIKNRTFFRLKNTLPEGVLEPDTSWWLAQK